MRIACCLSIVVTVAAACTSAPAPPASDTAPITVSGHTSSGATLLRIQRGSYAAELIVRRDDTVATTAEPASIDVLAHVPATAIVVVDRYPSQPGGLSLCQAGEERFLRVIAIGGDRPRETLTTKLASCHQNVELADRGVEWDGPAMTLRVHWLSSPDGNTEVRAIRIDGNGNAHSAVSG